MRRKTEPFYTNPNTGSRAYVAADEYWVDADDRRPRVVYRQSFWKDEDERLRYEKATAACPTHENRHMDLFQYLAEVATLAEGMKPPSPFKETKA